MRSIRLYSHCEICTALVLLLSACAGCWEKIEYKGPRNVLTTPKSPAAPVGQESQPESTSAPSAGTAVGDTNSPPVDAASAPEVSATTASDGGVAPVAAVPAEIDATDDISTPAAPIAPQVAEDRYAPASVPEASEASGPVPNSPQPPGANSAAESASPAPNPVTVESPPVDATPASATSDVQPSEKAINPQRAAWLIGSRLSLAALAHDRGVAPDKVPVWLADAESAAKLLGTSIENLPAPASPNDPSPASRQAINYLLVNGQRIGRELSKQHDMEQSALFEIALKSNILLLLYTPGSSAGGSIATAVEQAGPQTKLPAELWQPLVETLKRQAPRADVQAAVKKLHIDAEAFLSAEQGSR